MNFNETLISGEFIKRYKRFFVDIKIGNNPIGSITKKSITNAVTNNSNIVESKEKII